MPKTMKTRIYTYDQLDAILHKRGSTVGSYFMARLYSKVFAAASSHRIAIMLLDGTMRPDFRVADVWKVAGGDTVYRVIAPSKDNEYRRKPVRRRMYRTAVQRFTPRVIKGRLPPGDAWYRISGGVPRPMHVTAAVATTREPENFSLLEPRCTRPSYAEWIAPQKDRYPKLCGRAKAFYIRLRRELAGGLPCDVQLLRPVESVTSPFGGVYANALHLHVCLPPTERTPSARLILVVQNHDAGSRKRLSVDGDFGVRHSRVTGHSRRERGLTFEWKSTKDAIIGVKEWVLSSVYIPGL